MTIGRILSTAILLGLPLLGGCGSHAPHPTALEAVELLDVLQEDLKRHDPKDFLEIDLGDFRVTRTLGPDQGNLVVRFHLYGVLPEDREPEFKERWEKYDKRLRDAVIGILQKCDEQQLTAPRPGILKAELTAKINETLHIRSLRDVAFSELTIERN